MKKPDVWKSPPETMGRPVLTALLGICALLLTAAPAAAQVRVGIRGGTSVAPAVRIRDVTAQAYVGAHVETKPVVGRLVFRPNVETALGDGLVVVAINGEFVWKFAGARSGWSAYAGAGPAMSVFWFGRGRFGQRDTEVAARMSFLGGVEHRSGVFFEGKLGVLDRPDIARPLLDGVTEVKVGVGYSWK